MSFTAPANQTIPHQEAVEAVVDKRLTDFDPSGADHLVQKAGGTIAVPASPGASYVQAEVVALRTAISSIITKLQASGLID